MTSTPPAPDTAFSAYRVEHETRYAYSAATSQSWHVARLTPRALPWQSVLDSGLQVEPAPAESRTALDAFGNTITRFSLHGAHRALKVRMRCHVEVGDRPALKRADDGPWEAVCDAVCSPGGRHLSPEAVAAAMVAEPTRLVPFLEVARNYAQGALQPGRPWFEAVHDLMRRIHTDFDFDSEATTVSTSVEEVMVLRRGVCQDFAHVMLACLRSHGLPARYVSGYLLTRPPPGQARLIGADASHAWVAAYSPVHGWVEFDPTNDQLADRRHITLAWGGDFGDVAPLRGVLMGSGAQQLKVAVSVIPLDASEGPER